MSAEQPTPKTPASQETTMSSFSIKATPRTTKAPAKWITDPTRPGVEIPNPAFKAWFDARQSATPKRTTIKVALPPRHIKAKPVAQTAIRAQAEARVRAALVKIGEDEDALPAGHFANYVRQMVEQIGAEKKASANRATRHLISVTEAKFEQGMVLNLSAPEHLLVGEHAIEARIQATDYDANAVSWRYALRRTDGQSVIVDEAALLDMIVDPRAGWSRIERVVADVFEGEVAAPGWKPVDLDAAVDSGVERFKLLDLNEGPATSTVTDDADDASVLRFRLLDLGDDAEAAPVVSDTERALRARLDAARAVAQRAAIVVYSRRYRHVEEGAADEGRALTQVTKADLFGAIDLLGTRRPRKSWSKARLYETLLEAIDVAEGDVEAFLAEDSSGN